jgi:hypothetical protein
MNKGETINGEFRSLDPNGVIFDGLGLRPLRLQPRVAAGN